MNHIYNIFNVNLFQLEEDRNDSITSLTYGGGNVTKLNFQIHFTSAEIWFSKQNKLMFIALLPTQIFHEKSNQKDRDIISILENPTV